MGAGGRALPTIAERTGPTPALPGQAGLFHAAFLPLSRAALARWIAMAPGTRLPVAGAADH